MLKKEPLIGKLFESFKKKSIVFAYHNSQIKATENFWRCQFEMEDSDCLKEGISLTFLADHIFPKEGDAVDAILPYLKSLLEERRLLLSEKGTQDLVSYSELLERQFVPILIRVLRLHTLYGEDLISFLNDAMVDGPELGLFFLGTCDVNKLNASGNKALKNILNLFRQISYTD